VGLLHLGLLVPQYAVPTGSVVAELTHTRPSPPLASLPTDQAAGPLLQQGRSAPVVCLASQPTSRPPLLKPDYSASLRLLQKSKKWWLKAEQRTPAQPPLICISSQNAQSKVALCHLSAAFQGFP